MSCPCVPAWLGPLRTPVLAPDHAHGCSDLSCEVPQAMSEARALLEQALLSLQRPCGMDTPAPPSQAVRQLAEAALRATRAQRAEAAHAAQAAAQPPLVGELNAWAADRLARYGIPRPDER